MAGVRTLVVVALFSSQRFYALAGLTYVHRDGKEIQKGTIKRSPAQLWPMPTLSKIGLYMCL